MTGFNFTMENGFASESFRVVWSGFLKTSRAGLAVAALCTLVALTFLLSFRQAFWPNVGHRTQWRRIWRCEKWWNSLNSIPPDWKRHWVSSNTRILVKGRRIEMSTNGTRGVPAKRGLCLLSAISLKWSMARNWIRHFFNNCAAT